MIEKSKSLEKVKLILKCSNNLLDFIQVLNEKKELIANYFDKNINENSLILNEFFDLENALSQKIDENFYFI